MPIDAAKKKVLDAVRKYGRAGTAEALKPVPESGPDVEIEIEAEAPGKKDDGGPSGMLDEEPKVVRYPGHEAGCSCAKCNAAKELDLDAETLESLMGDEEVPE